jgi:hypothetical protein
VKANFRKGGDGDDYRGGTNLARKNLIIIGIWERQT